MKCDLQYEFLIFRPDPDKDVLVRWTKTGESHVVTRRDLRYTRPLRIGDTVVMPWEDDFYEGRVLDIAASSSSDPESSDSESNIPLARLPKSKLCTY